MQHLMLLCATCMEIKARLRICYIRCELYCAKGGKVDSEPLPPRRTSLRLHMKPASYQAAIWRRAVIPHPDVPSPHWHGWKVCSTSKLVEFVRLGTKPAPESKKSLNYYLAHAKEFALLKHEYCLKAGLLMHRHVYFAT